MKEKDKIINLMNDLGINIESIFRLSFSGYKQMKQTKQLYSSDVSTPEELITLYYSLHPNEVHFDNMQKAFITRYVNNENKVDGILEKDSNNKDENAGFRRMYEFIQSNEINQNFGIETLKKLHLILFSNNEVEHNAGELRTINVQNSILKDVYLDSKQISTELNDLDMLAKKLFETAPYIKRVGDPKVMLNFMDECIKFSCMLIKTHPFIDGNGVVIRGFINKLFIDAGLPLIYIRDLEKEEYYEAIDKAICNNDFEDITNFYRYKVCDSIIELDINERTNDNPNDNNKNKTTVPIEINSKIKSYERERILKYFDYIGLDIENIIRLCFSGYKYLKHRKQLYGYDTNVPETLISLYYSLNPGEISFNHMRSAFITKYVNNECIVEQVHTKEEKDGFKVMYEYIQSDDINYMFDVYTLLELHRKLYSLVPYPEFGGTFRNDQVYLPGSGANLSPWYEIRIDLENLDPEIKELHEIGPKIKGLNDLEKTLEYMDKCVIIGCKLVLIHPFWDGNGRSIRGFVNKLLEDGGLPPIYIRANEKLEYQQAMEKAICENNYESIINFYRYKICDSIIELDINDRVRKFNEERGMYDKHTPSYTSEEEKNSYALKKEK